jgi:hypothetical protein
VQSALKDEEQNLYSLIIRVSYVDLSGPTNLWERNKNVLFEFNGKISMTLHRYGTQVAQTSSIEPYDFIAFIACRVKVKYKAGVYKFSKPPNCSGQDGDMN